MTARSTALRSIHRERLVDEIARTLRDAIARGELAPGSRLVQDQLAAELGVSRTPLRDALQKLQYEGLVTLSRGRGVEVRRVDAADTIDLYDVREVLDGLAARLAARRATDEDIAALTTILDEMERAIAEENAHAALTGNVEFHERLVTTTRNAALVDLMPTIRQSARTFYPRVLLDEEHLRQALTDHRAILAAIAAHDAEQAETRAREHIALARREVTRHVTPDAGTHPPATPDLNGAAEPVI